MANTDDVARDRAGNDGIVFFGIIDGDNGLGIVKELNGIVLSIDSTKQTDDPLGVFHPKCINIKFFAILIYLLVIHRIHWYIPLYCDNKLESLFKPTLNTIVKFTGGSLNHPVQRLGKSFLPGKYSDLVYNFLDKQTDL